MHVLCSSYSHTNVFLKRCWTCFHLNFFHRSPVIFPAVPVDSKHTYIICSAVLTIEIGFETVFVPPTTFVCRSAVVVTRRFVIISVFGPEHHSVVITQWITSIALKIFGKTFKDLNMKYHYRISLNLIVS